MLYSRVSNKRSVRLFSFQEKSYPVVIIITRVALCIYLGLENTLPFSIIPHYALIRYSRVPILDLLDDIQGFKVQAVWHRCLSKEALYLDRAVTRSENPGRPPT